MKEKFEKRLLTGNLNVKCKNDDNSFRMWTAKKEEVINDIVDIVSQYRKLGYKLTLRQLHYQLVSRNKIVNHQTAYKKLGTILDDCRYGGIIDWNSIEDRGRVPKLDYYVDGIAQALEKTASHYKLDRQQGQENYIEVWTEKDALSSIFNRTTSKYHLTLCVNKGYTSSSAIYQSYERLSRIMNSGKSATILYFGDHDPSGLDMVRDIEERLRFMFEKGDCCKSGYNFTVEAIGLTMEQISLYNLPENPTKITDTRADSYIKKFGPKCWEVDALSPEILTALLEEAIVTKINLVQFVQKLEEEQNDRAELMEIADNYE